MQRPKTRTMQPRKVTPMQLPGAPTSGMKKLCTHLLWTPLLCAALVSSPTALAQQQPVPPQQSVPPQQHAQPQMSPQDSLFAAVNQRLNESLRERDAIIRNLLERVQELERRVNGDPTSASSKQFTAAKSIPTASFSSSTPSAPARPEAPPPRPPSSSTPATTPKSVRPARRSTRRSSPAAAFCFHPAPSN